MNHVHKGLNAYKKAAQPEAAPAKDSAAAPLADQVSDEVQLGGAKPAVTRPQFPSFQIQKTAEPPAQPNPPVAEKPAAGPAPAKAADRKKGLLKTGTERSIRKVAKFLILLGRDEAVKVVRHLTPAEIEELGAEISTIKTIDSHEAELILKEFGYAAKKLPGSAHGGTEVAASILENAFGKDKSKTILQKAVPDTAPKPFEFLAELEVAGVIALLRGESLPVLTMVLPHLDPAVAAKVLATFEADVRTSLIKRLAKIEKVSQDIVARVETGLRDKARHLGGQISETIDGKTRLAEILRHMDMSKEQAILGRLEISEPETASEIRERLFTLETILKVFDEDMEVLLRDWTEQDLALILKGIPAQVEPKFATNMSGRRLALIRQEQDLLGPTPQSEVNKAVKAFLEKLRDGVRTGRIRLADKEEEYL